MLWVHGRSSHGGCAFTRSPRSLHFRCLATAQQRMRGPLKRAHEGPMCASQSPDNTHSEPNHMHILCGCGYHEHTEHTRSTMDTERTWTIHPKQPTDSHPCRPLEGPIGAIPHIPRHFDAQEAVQPRVPGQVWTHGFTQMHRSHGLAESCMHRGLPHQP